LDVIQRCKPDVDTVIAVRKACTVNRQAKKTGVQKLGCVSADLFASFAVSRVASVARWKETIKEEKDGLLFKVVKSSADDIEV